MLDADLARFERNRSWGANPDIPAWVDIETVGLDQFFTRAHIAERCHESLLRWMARDGARSEDYAFIEPGAGAGAFYDLLPPTRRIGIDVLPLRADVVRADFLGWRPPTNGHRHAVIGNPPFGYRAWLALAFMNHAACFADYVGMILPMAFQSDGKGSPKHRVEGLRLMHSEILPPDSFTDTRGQPAKINALWQVWQRGVNNNPRGGGCDSWLDLFTVDMRRERLCGQARLHEADYFLQRTFYDRPPSLVTRFEDVRYVCGYGLVIKRDKDRIVELLKRTDWRAYAHVASPQRCRNV